MKITIELDLPEGQAIPRAEDIARLTNTDWIASWWHISDVQDCFNDETNEQGFNLSDEEAREVLRLADKYHDCEQGINWEVLYSWAEDVINNRKEAA